MSYETCLFSGVFFAVLTKFSIQSVASLKALKHYTVVQFPVSILISPGLSCVQDSPQLQLFWNYESSPHL